MNRNTGANGASRVQQGDRQWSEANAYRFFPEGESMSAAVTAPTIEASK